MALTHSVSDYERLRRAGLAQAGIAPLYPHKFSASTTVERVKALATATDASPALDPAAFEGAPIHSIMGRIVAIRTSGAKLLFLTIESGATTVQVVLSRNLWSDEPHFNCANENTGYTFETFASLVRMYDVVGFAGHVGKTRTGEPSLLARHAQVLSYCMVMCPMPHQAGALSDEVRARQRELHLMTNMFARDTFLKRSLCIRIIREFLHARGFIEVETPQMSLQAGGAAARPFVTHHNELDLDMFMRIAPELFLKRCVVGGLDRVFEIGKQFRNEGMDRTHNPEFTSIEAYCAGWDYEDLIDLTESLICELVQRICGSLRLVQHPDGPDGREVVLDFTRPWRRIPMMEGLQEEMNREAERSGFDPADMTLPGAETLETEAARERLDALCVRWGVDCGAPRTATRLLDKLVGRFVEPLCDQPTFITEHPIAISPLAKYHRSKPGVSERFELFIMKREFCNAFTELNNPEVQRELFMSQARQSAAGDAEAMPYDEEFCRALDLGLPPTGGWGMGIDRLVMMLSDKPTIRDVMLFPAMRPQEGLVREAEAEAAGAGAV